MTVSPDGYWVHESADVAEEATIGAGCRIWHQAQVVGNCVVGAEVSLGKGAYLGSGSTIGDRVKVQNYACIYGATVESQAFIGPHVVVIGDTSPRSTLPSGQVKTATDFVHRGAIIRVGASIGAGSIVMPAVEVGRFAMVSAGTVVHRDVPAHALVAGNPMRHIGWVCVCGRSVEANPDSEECTCAADHRVDGSSTQEPAHPRS